MPSPLPRLQEIDGLGPEALRRALSNWTRDVTQYLRDQPRWQVRHIEITDGVSTRVAVDFALRPLFVLIVSAHPKNTPESPLTVRSVPVWTWDRGSVVISEIDGLTAATAYDATILVAGSV